MGIIQRIFADAGAAQAFEIRSHFYYFTQITYQTTNVGSLGTDNPKVNVPVQAIRVNSSALMVTGRGLMTTSLPWRASLYAR